MLTKIFKLNHEWFDIKVGDEVLSQYGPAKVLREDAPPDVLGLTHGRYTISYNGGYTSNYPGYLLHRLPDSIKETKKEVLRDQVESDKVARCYDLKNLHTKVLLKYLQHARACGGIGYDPTENHGPEIPIEAIKAELATREHIPNKQESRKIRQEKAHGRKGSRKKKG